MKSVDDLPDFCENLPIAAVQQHVQLMRLSADYGKSLIPVSCGK